MDLPDQAPTMVGDEIVTDLADPNLSEVEQRDPPIPAVPVCVEGPIAVHRLPARKTAVITNALTTTPIKVLDDDPRRSAFLAVATEAWYYSRKATGVGAQIPADVPVRFEHSDAVYARAVTSTCEHSIIAEYWAD